MSHLRQKKAEPFLSKRWKKTEPQGETSCMLFDVPNSIHFARNMN